MFYQILNFSSEWSNECICFTFVCFFGSSPFGAVKMFWSPSTASFLVGKVKVKISFRWVKKKNEKKGKNKNVYAKPVLKKKNQF